MPDVFSDGIYSVRDLKDILGVSYQRIWAWFKPRKNQRDWLQKPSYEGSKGDLALTFYDLVEAWVAMKLISEGDMKPKEVLRNHKLLEKEYGIHPFSRLTVLGSYLGFAIETKGDTGATIYREPGTRQLINPAMAKKIMTRIKWGEDGFAEAIEPSRGVVLNPKFGFGQPVTAKSKLPTYMIFDAWKAQNKRAREVAQWFDISAREVEDAVEYERTRRRAA